MQRLGRLMRRMWWMRAWLRQCCRFGVTDIVRGDLLDYRVSYGLMAFGDAADWWRLSRDLRGSG